MVGVVNAIKSESVAEMTRILEEAEDQAMQNAQAIDEKKIAAQEQATQAMYADKQLDRDIQKYDTDMKWQIAVLNAETKGGEAELMLKIKEHENKVALEYAKVDETKRNNMAKEEETTRHNQEAEKAKPKTKV